MNLNDLQFFVQAVENGSFAAAARRLGVPKSTVSKRVGELEARLGARLIHRTSRSFSLTELGRDFFEHARASIIEAENAENIVRTRLGEPSGTVRLTTSVPTAQFTLAPLLDALSARYPKLLLSLLDWPEAPLSALAAIRRWSLAVVRSEPDTVTAPPAETESAARPSRTGTEGSPRNSGPRRPE